MFNMSKGSNGDRMDVHIDHDSPTKWEIQNINYL